MKLKNVLKWIVGIVLSVLLERLFNLIPIEKLFASEKWDWVVQDRFNIIDLVVFVVVLIIVFVIFTAIESKNGDRQRTKIKKHLEKKKTLIIEDKEIKITWDVAMPSIYNQNPHPYNINIFCTKHNPPLLMKHGRCLDPKCPNSQIILDESIINNYIESMLLDEQEKLKSN